MQGGLRFALSITTSAVLKVFALATKAAVLMLSSVRAPVTPLPLLKMLPQKHPAGNAEEEPEEDQPRPKAKRKPSKKRVANTAAVEAAQPSTPPAPERLPSDHGLHVTEVQINRAPVLTLWVAEVAKRQG